MGTLDHKAIRVQRAYRRYLWRRSRQPAEVTGIMDDVAVLATPKAIAAVAPRLEARLTRDGATLETTKCIWTTLGGPEIRKLFPEYAKVGCVASEEAPATGQSEQVGYGSDASIVGAGAFDAGGHLSQKTTKIYLIF